MKLEDQVCSLELAKRLKELGAKQESAFEYRVYLEAIYPFGLRETSLVRSGSTKDSFPTYFNKGRIEVISAFTVAELGEMLPQTIDIDDDDSPYYFNQHLTNANDKRQCQVRYGGPGFGFCVIEDKEADARAKMLCLLLEKGIL